MADVFESMYFDTSDKSSGKKSGNLQKRNIEKFMALVWVQDENDGKKR